MTHTKTFNILNPWAETTPWDCLIRETKCCSKTHDHSPMVNDECAWPGCDERLRDREVCYAVIELKKKPGERGEPWVCWRHVCPDNGPITIAREVKSLRARGSTEGPQPPNEENAK